MESCKAMKCEVERGQLNWTTCYSQADCSDIDYLWEPKSRGQIYLRYRIVWHGDIPLTPGVNLYYKTATMHLGVMLHVADFSEYAYYFLSGEVFDDLSDLLQLADIFFSLANVLSFARTAHSCGKWAVRSSVGVLRKDVTWCCSIRGGVFTGFCRLHVWVDHTVQGTSVWEHIFFEVSPPLLSSSFVTHHHHHHHRHRYYYHHHHQHHNHHHHHHHHHHCYYYYYYYYYYYTTTTTTTTIYTYSVPQTWPTLSSLFWATFGMGDTKAAVIDSRFWGPTSGWLPPTLLTTLSPCWQGMVFSGHISPERWWCYSTCS